MQEDSDDTGEAESSAEGCSNDTETSSSNDVATTSSAEESIVYYEASEDILEGPTECLVPTVLMGSGTEQKSFLSR